MAESLPTVRGCVIVFFTSFISGRCKCFFLSMRTYDQYISLSCLSTTAKLANYGLCSGSWSKIQFIMFHLLLCCVCVHVLTRIWNRTFFSSVSARAESFFSKSKFLKLLFCWTSWIALTNLPYSSSRSLWVYKHDKQTNKNKSKNTWFETVIINHGDSFCL